MKQIHKICLLICCITFSVDGQNDKQGSKDHPLISRFNQSYIYNYEETSFDAYSLATGKETENQISSFKEIEGKVFKIFYALPTSAGSTYEIFTNYKKALQAKGATILFDCKNKDECGKYFWDNRPESYLMPSYYSEKLAYLAAKFSKNGMAYYISVTAGYGLSEQGYEIHVIETKEMEQQIDLDGIEEALNKDGKISLYGILFDTGSAKIKDSSYPEIALVAEYLNKNNSKKLYIVGHTDNTGNYNNNKILSEKRAQAVVNYLKFNHNINENRLTAAGVGPVSPVSKNTTPEGLMKNRRVEIVLNEI